MQPNSTPPINTLQGFSSYCFSFFICLTNENPVSRLQMENHCNGLRVEYDCVPCLVYLYMHIGSNVIYMELGLFFEGNLGSCGVS